MNLLNNKIVFLTGGSSGIGYECAKAYARHGAKVIVAALEKKGVESVITELGAEHLGIVCDVSSAVSVKEAIKKVVERYGRIDVIHNNAGIAAPLLSIA